MLVGFATVTGLAITGAVIRARPTLRANDAKVSADAGCHAPAP